MNMSFLEGYLLLPLGVAVATYVVVHFQLLLLNRLLDLGLTHGRRTRINIMTFFVSFFAVLVLVMAKGYAGG